MIRTLSICPGCKEMSCAERFLPAADGRAVCPQCLPFGDYMNHFDDLFQKTYGCESGLSADEITGYEEGGFTPKQAVKHLGKKNDLTPIKKTMTKTFKWEVSFIEVRFYFPGTTIDEIIADEKRCTAELECITGREKNKGEPRLQFNRNGIYFSYQERGFEGDRFGKPIDPRKEALARLLKTCGFTESKERG